LYPTINKCSANLHKVFIFTTLSSQRIIWRSEMTNMKADPIDKKIKAEE